MSKVKHVQEGFMSQLTPVSVVETALPNLCQIDIREELAETPQYNKYNGIQPAIKAEIKQS